MDKVYVRFSVYILIVFGLVIIPWNLKQEKITQLGMKAQVLSINLIKPPQKKKIKKLVKKPKPKPKKKPKPKPIIKPKPKPAPIVEKIIEPEPVVEEPLKEEVKSLEDENRKAQIAEAIVAKKTYYDKIYEAIADNKKYPKKAKRYKQEGSVKVSFKVLSDGTITDLELLEPSKFSSLNKAVKKLFKKLKKFQTPPSNLSFPLELSLTINYKLKR